MRIEGLTQAHQGNAAGKKIGLSLPTTFQQLLSTKRQDSIIIGADTLSATSISPGDSTEMKLAKLAKLSEQTDYSTMSYEEIYETLWNRYNDAFDGNLPAIKACAGGPVSWEAINNQFVDETNKNILYPIEREFRLSTGASYGDPTVREHASAALRETRLKAMGYEGMDFDEIESAIAKKYQGKNSTLDFLNRQGEMFITGYMDHKMGEMGAASYQALVAYRFEVNYNPLNPYENRPEVPTSFMTDEQWQRVANQPFDTKKLAAEMKSQLTRMRFEGYPLNIKEIISSAIEQLL